MKICLLSGKVVLQTFLLSSVRNALGKLLLQTPYALCNFGVTQRVLKVALLIMNLIRF